MEAFIIGLFSILVGVLLIFSGYQFFRVLVPLWALFAGFLWSAQAVTIGLGTGFLTTVLSWVVGILVGFIFAIFAYVYYKISLGILAGFLTYLVVGSILLLSGVSQGLNVTLISSLFGIILGTIAVSLELPRRVLITLTAVGGSTIAVAGFLVMFGVQPLSILGSSTIYAIVDYSFGFSVVWAGLIIMGVLSQVRISDMMNLDDIGYPTRIYLMGMKGGKALKRKRTE